MSNVRFPEATSFFRMTSDNTMVETHFYFIRVENVRFGFNLVAAVTGAEASWKCYCPRTI